MPRRCMPSLPAIAAALAVASGACGVGVHDSLNAARTERQIAAQLASQYGLPAPAVSCPKSVPAAPGRSFTCSTSLDGQPLQLEGTVTDRRGHFTVVPEAAVIVVARAEAQLVEGVAAGTGSKPAISCGNRAVLVVAPGHTFTCSATFRGQRPRRLTVTIVDLEGHVTYLLAPP